MIPTVEREVDTFIHVIWNAHIGSEHRKKPFCQMEFRIIYTVFQRNMDWKNVVGKYFFIILLFQQVFVYIPCKISFKSTKGFVEHCCFINIGVCPFEYHKVKQGLSGWDH